MPDVLLAGYWIYCKLTDYVVPNLVGVDIGCGVTAFRLQIKKEIDSKGFAKD